MTTTHDAPINISTDTPLILDSPTTGAPTAHARLLAWVAEVARLTTPDAIHWVDGSEEEYEALIAELVDAGTFVRLTAKTDSFWCASDPTDVARVEDRTFICSRDEDDAGPTNNWMDPDEMKAIMTDLYRGCMRGRTMYVIPFVMGHLDAEKPMFGVEITDSAYVVASMRIMARMRHRRPATRWASDAAFVPAPALRRRPARAGPGRRRLAVQRHQVHRPLPRGARDLVATAPATAATRCSARSATRCASPR